MAVTLRDAVVRLGMAAVLGAAMVVVPEAFGPGQSAYAGCSYCRRTSRGCSCGGRCPCHRSGGGGGGTGVALAPMKWETLEAAQAKSASASKPLVVVFCTKGFDGPATFNTNRTRDAWKASGALAARVLPPEQPVFPANMSNEQYQAAKARLAEYQQIQAKYQELLKKYGAEANPTLVCLAPDGAVLARLYGPGHQDVANTLNVLPKAVKAYEERKAKEAETKARPPEKSPTSSAPAKPDIAVPAGAAAAVTPAGS